MRHFDPYVRPFRPRPRWLTWLLRCTRLSSLVATMSLLSGCLTALSSDSAALNATPAGSANDWKILAPGLEQRTYTPGGDNLLLQLTVLRIDPAHFSFRTHYQPGEARSIERWQSALPDAAAFINTNFFTPQHEILGLLVADSLVYGQSYRDRGGTFYVQGGAPGLRSNLVTPYNGELFEQSVQGFPMLVVDGQAAYTNPNDNDVSRRSLIAQDAEGCILLMATNLIGIRLNSLSAWLAASDMNIVTAMNLDGGGSTMFYIGADDPPFLLRSFDPVPAVLAVYARPD